MDTNNLRQLIKKLQLVMRCPSCGKRYNLDEIFLRGQMDHHYFLQMNCSNCRTPVFATIAISGNIEQFIDRLGTSIFPENETEIMSGQTIRFHTKAKDLTKAPTVKPITDDNILDFHQSLENFDGDFSKLFNS